MPEAEEDGGDRATAIPKGKVGDESRVVMMRCLSVMQVQ